MTHAHEVDEIHAPKFKGGLFPSARYRCRFCGKRSADGVTWFPVCLKCGAVASTLYADSTGAVGLCEVCATPAPPGRQCERCGRPLTECRC
jgi:hypothetical protein